MKKLTQRAQNILNSEEIKTKKQGLKKIHDDGFYFFKLPNCGKKTAAEIYKWLGIEHTTLNRPAWLTGLSSTIGNRLHDAGFRNKQEVREAALNGYNFESLRGVSAYSATRIYSSLDFSLDDGVRSNSAHAAAKKRTIEKATALLINHGYEVRKVRK